MGRTFTKAKQEVIERWKQAFDEFDQFERYESEVADVKYSKENGYDIGNYENGKLKSESKLLNKPPLQDSYYEFGLNEKKLPVISILINSNTIGWIGFYKWNEDTVEYIEFCYSNKVPSSVHRLSLKNNKKVLLQLLNLNAKGGYPIFLTLSKDDIIKHALSDTYTLILDIKNYQYSDEKISKSYGLASVPGIAEYGYEDVYSYDDKFSLNKIERFTENWPPQIIYKKPSGKIIGKLIDDLSKILSDTIIDILDRTKIIEPIFNVQLNYHAVDNYWPYITIITEKEREEAKTNKTESLFLSHTPVANEELRDSKSEELNEMFAEFDQYVRAKEAWHKGSDLLIRTSRLMTENKLKGKIPVTKDFIVFATDWSMMEDIEKILLKCGANKIKVKEWKELNWF